MAARINPIERHLKEESGANPNQRMRPRLLKPQHRMAQDIPNGQQPREVPKRE
jgi:hypothetical protein